MTASVPVTVLVAGRVAGRAAGAGSACRGGDGGEDTYDDLSVSSVRPLTFCGRYIAQQLHGSVLSKVSHHDAWQVSILCYEGCVRVRVTLATSIAYFRW